MAALQVYPGASHPSHELSLSDGVLTWGLRLQGGAAGIKETLLTPSGLRLNWVSGFAPGSRGWRRSSNAIGAAGAAWRASALRRRAISSIAKTPGR
jgi:hypothetical protein